MRKYWKEKNRYIAEKEKSADAGIKRMMLTSVLGMLICVVCLAGTTWAWFTATQNATVGESQVAQTLTKVSIKSIGSNTLMGSDVKNYSIDSNEYYAVTLTEDGTADGVYCAVSVDGTTYYTSCMASGEKLSFTVCSRDGDMTVATSWNEMTHTGSSARKAMSRTKSAPLREGDVIGEGEPVKEDENKDNSNSHDTAKKAPVIKEADDTKAPAQDGSNDDSTSAQEIKPEQDNSETQGKSEE